jgi:hypothetical protein
MKISEKQIAAVLSLPGSERYKHFVKRVADTETAWGLYEDGWALAATDDGVQAFLLWPAEEYAKLCAVDSWSDFVPRALPVDELLQELLPKLEQDGMLPGIFMTPQDKGVTPAIALLRRDLEAELENYE